MGGRLLAVSVDSPEQSRRVVDRQKLPFSILSDEDGSIIRAYGVLHSGGGPGGSDIALPAQFLIDRDQKVRWQHVAERIQDRPDPREISQAIQKLAQG